MYKQVLLIIIYDNEVLAVKEKNIKNNKWTLPLGTYKLGEGPLQCAIRSTYESLGIVLSQIDLIASDLEQNIMFFKLSDKQVINIFDEKISDARFLKISQFKEQAEEKNKQLLESPKFLLNNSNN